MKWFNKMMVAVVAFTFSVVSMAESEPKLQQPQPKLQQPQPQLDMKDPYQLIHNVAEQTFSRFKTDSAIIDQDLNHIKVIVEQELMPYINSKFALAMILGKNYRKLSKDQKARFVKVFYEYLIINYANMFTLYDQQQVTYGAGAGTWKLIKLIRDIHRD